MGRNLKSDIIFYEILTSVNFGVDNEATDWTRVQFHIKEDRHTGIQISWRREEKREQVGLLCKLSSITYLIYLLLKTHSKSSGRQYAVNRIGTMQHA